MGSTIIEKILARASGLPKVSPGDLVEVNVDCAVFNDSLGYFLGTRDLLKVAHPERIVIVIDHEVPAPNIGSANAQEMIRAFARQFGIERFVDVGPETGISHVIVAERAYALPGTVLVCDDSHTCSAGALNCAARGITMPDMIFAITTGKTWFRVGETIRYELHGRLGPAAAMKDVFLHIAGTYGHHATQNVEYGGPALQTLSLDARRTLTTMGAELSAEFSTFEADRVLIDFIRQRTDASFEPQAPDEDASYRERRTIHLDAIEPLVALPDAIVNNTVPVTEVAGVSIQQAFIGSCANGTLDDMKAAANVVAGRRVAPGVRFIVTPGSQQIYREALEAGYVSTLVQAGALVTNSTCGACGGFHMGVLAANETCITASTRNFKGRMGDPSARIYMGSPATVAASALTGVITHPGEFAPERPE